MDSAFREPSDRAGYTNAGEEATKYDSRTPGTRKAITCREWAGRYFRVLSFQN
jgi:hypothetical protein